MAMFIAGVGFIKYKYTGLIHVTIINFHECKFCEASFWRSMNRLGSNKTGLVSMTLG